MAFQMTRLLPVVSRLASPLSSPLRQAAIPRALSPLPQVQCPRFFSDAQSSSQQQQQGRWQPPAEPFKTEGKMNQEEWSGSSYGREDDGAGSDTPMESQQERAEVRGDRSEKSPEERVAQSKLNRQRSRANSQADIEEGDEGSLEQQQNPVPHSSKSNGSQQLKEMLGAQPPVDEDDVPSSTRGSNIHDVGPTEHQAKEPEREYSFGVDSRDTDSGLRKQAHKNPLGSRQFHVSAFQQRYTNQNKPDDATLRKDVLNNDKFKIDVKKEQQVKKSSENSEILDRGIVNPETEGMNEKPAAAARSTAGQHELGMKINKEPRHVMGQPSYEMGPDKHTDVQAKCADTDMTAENKRGDKKSE